MTARVQETGQSESRSEEQLFRHGHPLPVRLTCLPLWEKNDRVLGTALVIHDLSHQRTLEESARRNESLARLGTMVAGLAHEVRNPLAGIKGAAQLLAAPPRRRPQAERVHRRHHPRGRSSSPLWSRTFSRSGRLPSPASLP